MTRDRGCLNSSALAMALALLWLGAEWVRGKIKGCVVLLYTEAKKRILVMKGNK